MRYFEQIHDVIITITYDIIEVDSGNEWSRFEKYEYIKIHSKKHKFLARVKSLFN